MTAEESQEDVCGSIQKVLLKQTVSKNHVDQRLKAAITIKFIWTVSIRVKTCYCGDL